MLFGSKTLMQRPIHVIYHGDSGRNEDAYPWHDKVVIEMRVPTLGVVQW